LDDFSMRQLSQLLSGFFLLLVFAASVTFTYYNSTPVIIGIGSWQLQAMPVSVWIVGAFVSGGLLGLVLGLGLFRNLKSRVEIRRLNKALRDAQEEVSNLRALSLHDTKK
jgi:lipopolysaccharide assembly protein A